MKKTRACFIASSLLLASCSSSTDSPFGTNALSRDAGNTSNGGSGAGTGGQSSSSGGASGSGGVVGNAGASNGGTNSGGSSGSAPDASVLDASVGPDASANSGGGTTSSGGAASTGGTVGTGGSTGTGGSAGAASTGGTSDNGGSAGAGGVSTGGTSGGGSTGTGGVSSSGGSGDSGGTSGGGGTASGGASGSGGASSTCSAQTCNLNFFSCCGDACVNFENDPFHCGDCDTKCDAGKMCLGGSCTKPPCVAVPGGGPGPLPPQCNDPATCCSGACCGVGMLCCEHIGGVAGVLECIDPAQSDGTCPRGNPAAVCASPDTPIATPSGERAIASLRVGELVYSVDHGKVVAVPLVEVHRSLVSHHHVVHLELENGVSLEISGPHPTADGRLFRGLHSGDRLGGVLIRTASDVPYTHDYTYDVLPASDSGTYFAGGVLIGSTLGGEASALRPIDFAAISMPTEAGLQSR